MDVIAKWAWRIWESITEPRHLKTFFFVAYLITIGIGLVTLFNPPSSIEGPLGPILTRFWASLLLLGGAGAAASVFPGWWWVERSSIWFIITGALIYAGIAFAIQVVAGPESSRWTQIGFIGLAAYLLSLRLVLTKDWDYEPRKG